MKHDTHTQSNSEVDCQLCGNINKKRFFCNAGPTKEVCVVGGIFII